MDSFKVFVKQERRNRIQKAFDSLAKRFTMIRLRRTNNPPILPDDMKNQKQIVGVRLVDDLLQPGVTDRLLNSALRLEHAALEQDKWHPDKDRRMLNLIDPSLYCAIEDKTLILSVPYQPKIEQINDYRALLHFGVPLTSTYFQPEPNVRIDQPAWAHSSQNPELQWLPSDVSIDTDGKAHFTSYVNGLHPDEHGDMYASLEEILTDFIPLFDNIIDGSTIKLMTSNDTKIENDVEVGNRHLNNFQVIVRMSSTLLTAEYPSHPGGDWHSEGLPTENIIAVGIHYYSQENITSSKLYLGKQVRNRCGGGSVQEVAPIDTFPGRRVVFLNSFCHRVSPFKLKDPSKPGYRRMVAFFLINPEEPILSTASVPCQQKEWYLYAIRPIFTSILPPEMFNYLSTFLHEHLDEEEARRFQEKIFWTRANRSVLGVFSVD